MCGQNGRDAQYARHPFHNLFAGFAERLLFRAFRRVHFKREADMPLAHDKSLHDAGAHHIIAGFLVSDGGKGGCDIVAGYTVHDVSLGIFLCGIFFSGFRRVFGEAVALRRGMELLCPRIFAVPSRFALRGQGHCHITPGVRVSNRSITSYSKDY